MKTLSFVVPCYNSQDHMRHCLDSLLPAAQDIEILIINDGSVDKTADIAEEYKQKYPGIVEVYHQENGGHGAAVSTGIDHASGQYLKVVDSDDWVDASAYRKMLEVMRGFDENGRPDLIISNYVYEKQGKKNKKVMQYRNIIPADKVIGWDEVGRFRTGHYMLMHSITYRTEMLKNSGLVLPRHTFYVDNLFAFVPLCQVKTLYYVDVDFYRYFIGREGQSVQEDVMIRRIDQQLYVNRLMVTSVDFDGIESPRLREYMVHYLEIVTMVSSILLMRSGLEENFQKKEELWQFINTQNPAVYSKLRHDFMGRIVHIPGEIGKKISSFAYKVSQKIVGFN